MLQMQLHWHPANMVRNMARAGLAQISGKMTELQICRSRTVAKL